MKLTKIKYKDGELTLTWLEDGGDRPTLHKHELVSKEAAEPDFHQALIAVGPHVLELPSAYAAPVTSSCRPPPSATTRTTGWASS